MALESTLLPFLQDNVLDTQSKFNSDLNKEIAWSLLRVELDNIQLNPLNNRFVPDEALSDEEHERAAIEEDPRAFENLVKSWGCNPQFEQLIGFKRSESSKIHLIAGHRRFFAAKRIKSTSVLVWVAEGLTAEDIEHIRDWPEIHQTKVSHTSYARSKAIYSDLKGKRDAERTKRLNIWKQKGYTKPQILKAERVYGRMESFCKSLGEKTQQRAGQMKAFETYDHICETQFDPLRDQGEISRLVTLDKVAKAFLKHQIAHDDLKITVEGLAKLPEGDPVFKAIAGSPEYLDEIPNLRRLTNLARSQRNSSDILSEVREFTSRTFSKLIDRADFDEMNECLIEMRDAVIRLESALSNISSRGAV